MTRSVLIRLLMTQLVRMSNDDGVITAGMIRSARIDKIDKKDKDNGMEFIA